MTTMRVVGECFFWYRLTRVFPDKFHRAVKRLCVCVWDAGMVVCLGQGADLHMAQLMPLPLTVSCFSKIQIAFTFLVPVHTHTQKRFTALWILSGTTRVSRYQKRHSPTHTHHGHQLPLICFFYPALKRLCVNWQTQVNLQNSQ